MNLSKKSSFTSRGQFISARTFNALRTGFTDLFSGEVSSVYIPKKVIYDCLRTGMGAAGVTFRYGLSDVNNPLSRTIFLIPCHDITDIAHIPRPIIDRTGYLCNTGERIALDQFWKSLGNHVARAYNGGGHAVLSRIHRAYSWGIEPLHQLLEHNGCEGVVFYFGYDPYEPRSCKRNQNILEAVDGDGKSLRVYLEYGQCDPPCPDPVEPLYPTCLAETLFSIHEKSMQSLEILRMFRDRRLLNLPGGYALHEMYYFLSPQILQRIQSLPDAEQILSDLYKNELLPCLALIQSGRMDEASTYGKAILNKLLDTYCSEDITTGAMALTN